MKLTLRWSNDGQAASSGADNSRAIRLRRLAGRVLADGMLPALAFVALALWFGRSWLGEGLPTGDFGGNASCLWFLKQSIAEGVWLPAWSRWWFCGQPTALVQPGLFGGLMAFLPFTAFWDPVQAIKVGSLVYFGLSGLCMYSLVRYASGSGFAGYLRGDGPRCVHRGLNSASGSRAAAYLGGLFYTLHPIHVSVAAWTGHPNFAPFYVWPPLVFLCLLRLARQISYGRVALLALVLAGMVAADIERSVTALVPIVAGALVYVRLVPGENRDERARRFWRFAAAVAAAGAVAFVLDLAFLGPALLESKHFTLFSPQVREESVRYFSLQNPVHLADRGGWLLGRWGTYLPGEFVYNKGFLYLSLVLVTLAGLAIRLARLPRERRLLWACATVSILGVWVAGGMYSFYDRVAALGTALYSRQDYLDGRPLEIPLVVGAVLASGAGVGAWRLIRRRKARVLAMGFSGRAVLVVAGLAFLFFAPAAMLFQYAPFLNHMRSPSWFLSFGPSLGLCLAAAFLPVVLRQRSWGRLAVGATALAAAALYVGDVVPYRKAFQAVEPASVERDLKQVAKFLADRAGREGPFRVLARETYNPRVDAQVIWSGVPQAWSWLNWASPRPVGELFLNEILAKLHRPETIAEACRLAGLAGVKYLIYDLTEGPPAPSNELLETALTTERFLVYRNQAFQPLVQFLPGRPPESQELRLEKSQREEVPYQLARPSDTQVRVSVTAPSDGTLVLSEAWHPGWTVRVDGRPAELLRVQKAFQGVRLSKGIHQVVFSYRPPSYVVGSRLASAVGFSGVLFLSLVPLRRAVAARLRLLAAASKKRWERLARIGTRRLEVAGLVVLLLAAAVVRFYNLGNTPRWFADEGAHVMIARSLMEGEPRLQALRLSWLDPYHCYPPGFDLAVLATMEITGHHVLAARAFTALASVVTVLVVFLIARRLAGPLAGWAAALAIAFHPLTVLFHRWGFAATPAGLGVAAAFLFSLRIRKSGSLRGVLAALGAGLGGMAFSYWSFPILIYLAYVVLTQGNRQLRGACMKTAVAVGIASVLALVVLGQLGWVLERITGTAQLAWTGYAQDLQAAGGPAKAVLGSLRQWLAVDGLLALGTFGLFLASSGWARRDLIIAFGLLATAPILTRADIMANFFYSALIFAPLVFVGLGCLAARVCGALAVLGRVLPGADGRALAWGSGLAGVAVACVLLVRTAWADYHGWRTPIDGFGVEDPAGAIAAARWIDQRTGPEDFVIATDPVGWLLRCRSAHALQATAYAGRPTTWLRPPPARGRFAFDCSAQRAKFLWMDPTLRYYAARQPNVDRILHEIEQESWPLVHRQGPHEVYANPRYWDGEVIARRALVIGVPDLYRRLGDGFMREGDHENALAAYERLLRLVPEDAEALNNAAVAAARLARWEEATRLWNRALAADPEMLAARQGLEAIREHLPKEQTTAATKS